MQHVLHLVCISDDVTYVTRSQAVARIADRTAQNCRVTLPRPRPLSGKIICAPARHCPYKAVYQI